MTAQTSFPASQDLNTLAQVASALGYEIVDVAGFLDLVEAQAHEQRNALTTVEKGAAEIEAASAAVQEATGDLGQSVTRTAEDVDTSAKLMRALGDQSVQVATWVQALSERSSAISETLRAVKNNNAQIASISMQVNTLAINELSRKTKDAASQISTNIDALTDWIATLSVEAEEVAHSATTLMEHSASTDSALGRMEGSVADTTFQTDRITSNTGKVRAAIEEFGPGMRGIGHSIAQTTAGIEKAHQRIEKLITTSETLVQSSAALGGMTDDAPFIDYACGRAAQIAAAFELAVAQGRISQRDLFDRNYVPIAGTSPQQSKTAYTDLLDHILPPLQEPALSFHPKVVFCAAVDVNGYLPTHNAKFSQSQSQDVVWNTAHCRNRRMFDDRVGLKAGRSIAPFLLQVYRRDMGGGEFKMMKDLSAPIIVNGRHWGGLRLAYTL